MATSVREKGCAEQRADGGKSVGTSRISTHRAMPASSQWFEKGLIVNTEP